MYNKLIIDIINKDIHTFKTDNYPNKFNYLSKVSLISNSEGVFLGKDIYNYLIKLFNLEINYNFNELDLIKPNQEVFSISGILSNIMKIQSLVVYYYSLISSLSLMIKTINKNVLNSKTKIIFNLKVKNDFTEEIVKLNEAYSYYSLIDCILLQESFLKNLLDIKQYIDLIYLNNLKFKKIICCLDNFKFFKEVVDYNVDSFILQDFNISELKAAISLNKGKKEIIYYLKTEDLKELVHLGLDYIIIDLNYNEIDLYGAYVILNE